MQCDCAPAPGGSQDSGQAKQPDVQGGIVEQRSSARTCDGIDSSPCPTQQVQGHPASPFSSLATLWHQVSSSSSWPKGGGGLLLCRRASCLLQGALCPALCPGRLLRPVAIWVQTRRVRRWLLVIGLLMSRWGVRCRGSCGRERSLGLLLLDSQDDARSRLLAGSNLCLSLSFLQACSGLCSGGQGSIWLARPAGRNPCRRSILTAGWGSVPGRPGLDIGRPCMVRPSRLRPPLRHLHRGRALHSSSTQGLRGA